MPSSRSRVRAMLVVIMFIFSVFAAQLVRIQGVDSADVAKEALLQRSVKQEIPAMRGAIYDSNGQVLADSTETRRVNVDQTAVPTYIKRVDGTRTKVGVLGAAQDLAPLLNASVSDLVSEMTGTSQYRIIAQNIPVATWSKIAKLGIPGVYSEPTSEREYPQSTTAASLVGWTYANGDGGGGIEKLADSMLVGRNGSRLMETSPNGRVIPSGRQIVTPATDGRDVQLTINADLQWYAQNVLAEYVQKFGALSGNVVAMNAKTGDLLAVASFPTYDPNDLSSATKGGSLDNLAFTEVFEPGSTNKIVTIAAALEEGKVTPETPVVIPNRIRRADRSFKDSHDHATEFRTVTGVLAESSNIGTILVGETMSKETMARYLHAFGLGQKSAINFPDESNGILAAPDKWDGAQRYTVLYGQGVAVTAIQAVSAFQVIANAGVRVEPRLIKAVADEHGVLQPTAPSDSTRVISSRTANAVSLMLEGVTSEEGTAPAAKIVGYRVAGKTATADRYDEKVGGYSGKTASFIGYAPADDPQIVISVTIQRPTSGFWGGTVAAPVFHDVMTYALQQLKIPPTGAQSPELELSLPQRPSKDTPGLLGGDYLGG